MTGDSWTDSRTHIRTDVRHLVFDLDDTLLDTFGQLIPIATREACEAMIAAGLNADLDQALAACRERELRAPRLDLFATLVNRFGILKKTTEAVGERADLAKIGENAFYNRRINEKLFLFDGARDLIGDLRAAGYGLHLVTQGHRATQETKVRLLKIESLFDSISYVIPANGERKRQAFSLIQTQAKLLPAQFLSIGNRIDTDIREARELGWKTCWVRYGEYRFMEPTLSIETPDYVIEKLSELRTVCRL